MRLEIDDVDFDFISVALSRAKAVHELLMTDASICQVNRDREREFAKMAKTARDILFAARSRISDKKGS